MSQPSTKSKLIEILEAGFKGTVLKKVIIVVLLEKNKMYNLISLEVWYNNSCSDQVKVNKNNKNKKLTISNFIDSNTKFDSCKIHSRFLYRFQGSNSKCVPGQSQLKILKLFLHALNYFFSLILLNCILLSGVKKKGGLLSSQNMVGVRLNNFIDLMAFKLAVSSLKFVGLN